MSGSSTGILKQKLNVHLVIRVSDSNTGALKQYDFVSVERLTYKITGSNIKWQIIQFLFIISTT